MIIQPKLQEKTHKLSRQLELIILKSLDVCLFLKALSADKIKIFEITNFNGLEKFKSNMATSSTLSVTATHSYLDIFGYTSLSIYNFDLQANSH